MTRHAHLGIRSLGWVVVVVITVLVVVGVLAFIQDRRKTVETLLGDVLSVVHLPTEWAPVLLGLVIVGIIGGGTWSWITLASRVSKMDEGARSAVSLLVQTSGVAKLRIDGVSGQVDALQRRIEGLERDAKDDRDNWRDQMKINNSSLESSLAQIKAATEMVKKAEERLTQRIEQDYEQMTGLFTRIKAIEDHLGLTPPDGTLFGRAKSP